MKESIKGKLALYFGGLFLLFLLGILTFDLARKGIFYNGLGINIAIVSDRGVKLLLLRPEEEMISLVKVPGNSRIKIFNSNALYPILSLWKYGEVERIPFEMIEKSIGQSMGVTVAKVIRLEGPDSIEDVLGRLGDINLKTDLSVRDRFLIRKFLAESLKSKRVLELNLPKSVFDLVIEPDGKEFLDFNSTVNLWAKNKFVLEPILLENADVSINNVTGIPGIGYVLSRQLESSGLHVLEVKAEQESKSDIKGCVFGVKGSFPMTEKFLTQQAKCLNKQEIVSEAESDGIWVLVGN